MLPLAVSEKLQQLAGGAQLPASALKHPVYAALIADGIIHERITGRTKRTLYITDAAALDAWLFNSYAINNLSAYILAIKNAGTGRAGFVEAGNDSKLKGTRTYRGFLVNSYTAIHCTLRGAPFTICPPGGTFQFIYDYEHFVPAPHVTIVGIENMENFRHVSRQAHFFAGITPLFVCRYPQQQSKDLMQWLQSIPNPYLHFGDFDFSGINIYLTEYKRHLHGRASFFIPPGINQLIARYGNPTLYNRQQLSELPITDDNIKALIGLLHEHKRGLEQECLLIQQHT